MFGTLTFDALPLAEGTQLPMPAELLEGVVAFLREDVADRLDQRGLMGFLEDCADRGLFLAPGPSFGSYPTHVRVCFTCSRPDVVDRGIEILAGFLGR